MPASAGHRPPRRLVALILAITVVPLGVFLWLGWRPAQQDRAIARQQRREFCDTLRRPGAQFQITVTSVTAVEGGNPRGTRTARVADDGRMDAP